MKPGVISQFGMRILPLLLVINVVACQKEKEKSLLEQYVDFLIQQYIANTIASSSCTMLASNYADAIAPDDIPGDVPYTNTDQGIDEAYPVSGPVVTKYMIINNRVQRVQLHDEGDKYIYGSDMLIPRDQVFDYPDTAEGMYYSFATGSTNVRWHKNGSTGKFDVPYELDGGLPVATQNEIALAIAHWEANSFFDFKVRTSEAEWIYFQSGSGCSSWVGRVGLSVPPTGGGQELTLEDACSTGNAVHEIGHALGLLHEQQRNDRDNHIAVYLDRTTDPTQYQKNSSGTDIGPYDFTSIMHYASDSFAIDTNVPVMTKLDGSWIYRQRDALTSCDVNGAQTIHSDPTYNSAL